MRTRSSVLVEVQCPRFRDVTSVMGALRTAWSHLGLWALIGIGIVVAQCSWFVQEFGWGFLWSHVIPVMAGYRFIMHWLDVKAASA